MNKDIEALERGLKFFEALKGKKVQNDYEMSQDKVAKEMFISRNTVMNIEKRALEKLKKAMKKRGITAKDVFED